MVISDASAIKHYLLYSGPERAGARVPAVRPPRVRPLPAAGKVLQL